MLSLLVAASSFTLPALRTSQRPRVPSVTLQTGQSDDICFSKLPGDPSLLLNVNVAMGDKKMEFMKACSAAIAETLSKPESYVAVSVNDGLDIIFGGDDAPAALGCVYSIGQINQENNGALTAKIAELLKPFGVPDNRMYLNFFDVPRANCGWSSKTFAG